jgi:hypothetical protein
MEVSLLVMAAGTHREHVSYKLMTWSELVYHTVLAPAELTDPLVHLGDVTVAPVD